ncbi:hypothetical protein [Microcystis aeruginosa]|uniref:hypothetical protein n=1 Tax=Microcystis aeruginosa TaxID=1126 RepID=UPI0020161F46|nr:hypothetical protein [Microcystis aeruginosa]
MPYVPITLGLNGRSLNTEGLIDTGASVNVLPYELGLQLGFIWENENLSVILAGNLAHCQARAVVVEGQVNPFPTVNPELPPYIYTTIAENPYPSMDAPP